jgi:predicted ATP-grasp superfamily ATP-dependent carboligase
MEHVRWANEPALVRPVVIVAFEGWNDAGDAASTAVRWLRDRWAPEPLAEIDAEEFFDFTSTRPQARLDDDGVRQIVWPSTDFWYGSESGRECVLALGVEPHLKWRTFCDQVVGIIQSINAGLVVTLGANLRDVPHTRPTPVGGSATDPNLGERLGLVTSRYEGPTGIVGVLHDACRRAGVPSLSLWASVPTYVHAAPSPKAALALVQRIADILDVSVTTTDLQIAAASYERQISDVVASDDDMREYLTRLEAHHEAEAETDVPSSANLVEEVERFLREQGTE